MIRCPSERKLLRPQAPASVLRRVLFAALLLFGAGCGDSDDGDDSLSGPPALAEVRFWAYQIQGLEVSGAVATLAASHYDLLVIEPTRTDWASDLQNFDTQAMVARLKESASSDGERRKLVIAYINIGEAEDWRWYWTWSTGWTPGAAFPEDWPNFILAPDPDGWGGNFPVAYWSPEWKDIVITGENQGSDSRRNYTSVLDEVIRDGFDGVYLDWVEGYEHDAVVQAAASAGKDPAAEMIALITEIRAHARARAPGFLVIQQNAAELAEGHPELFGAIDAIAQEGVWYDGDATDLWDDPQSYDQPVESDLSDYYIEYLNPYAQAGLPVFNCEYARERAATAYQRSNNAGFIPYCTRTSLSALTTTPPPGY